MLDELAFMKEGITTFGAYKQLHLPVVYHVLITVLLAAKISPALGADVMTAMHSLVKPKARFVCKLLPADQTHVVVIHLVKLLVFDEALFQTELLPAFQALILLLL